MSNIIYDDRWVGEHGIGRFAKEILNGVDGLRKIDLKGNPADKFDSIFLTKYLMKNKDVFFSPGYNPPLMFLNRSIITIHDLNHVDIDSNTSFLKRIYYNTILKRACKHSLRIFTVSEFSKRRICEWANIEENRVIVVGNGVSSAFNQYGDIYKIDSPYILSVGNRKLHKNEVEALLAYANSSLKNTHKYVFTGNISEELGKVISENKITDKVIFTGKVSDMELASLYRGASLLFFPSLYEGFGLPVIEAMSCGTPVITSNNTSLKEIAGNAAFLIDPKDQKQMIEALEEVSSNNFLRKTLIANGLIRVKKYSWSNTISKVNEELRLINL